jgi:hypothetical protein
VFPKAKKRRTAIASRRHSVRSLSPAETPEIQYGMQLAAELLPGIRLSQPLSPVIVPAPFVLGSSGGLSIPNVGGGQCHCAVGTRRC